MGDVQYKSEEGFDASSRLNYNSSTCTLNVQGNVATTALKTNNLLKEDGTPWQFEGQPGGSNATVQFNNSGAFNGSDHFTWNNSANLLTVSGTVNFAAAPSKLFGSVSTVSILGGSAGQILSTNGAGGLSWSSPTAGGVTQVATSGSGLGFSLSGGPITSTGTVTLTVPGATDLRTSLNIGNVANINLNGNASTVLSGGGTWIEPSSNYDKILNFTSSGGTVVHDFSLASVFNHESISANFTVNITNLGLNPGFGVNITLILNQGATARIPNAVQIAGVSKTIYWQGGFEPTGNANKKDLVSFSITNIGGLYTVFGQLISFG